MDTKTLIEEAKARFNHNSAKDYLKEKYSSKLVIADQGGLWKANLETITFLSNYPNEKVVLIDSFENPVEVDRKQLLDKLVEIYDGVMKEWHQEWKTLESKR